MNQKENFYRFEPVSCKDDNFRMPNKAFKKRKTYNMLNKYQPIPTLRLL